MIEYIQSFLIIIIEVSCYQLFFDIFLRGNYDLHGLKDWIWTISASIIICLISFVLSDCFLLKEFCIFIVWSSYFIIKDDVKLMKSAVISALYVLLINVADFLTITFNKAVLSINIDDNDIYTFMVVIMSKAMLLSLILIIGHYFYTNNKSMYISDIRLLILPVISIFCIAGMIKGNVKVANDIDMNYLWSVVFCLIAANVVTMWFVRDINIKHKLEQEVELYEIEAKNQIELYTALQKKVSEQRTISHEYKNQISYIQALLKNGDIENAVRYVDKIYGERYSGSTVIDTNNSVVNTILNMKYYEARELGISFTCKINDLSSLVVEEGDLVLIFINLLNNAIEGTDNTDNKYIYLKAVLNDGKLIITVKNSYNSILMKKGDLYLTTKNDDEERHGFGITNIIKSVKKYDGIYRFENSNNTFEVTIVMNNISKT